MLVFIANIKNEFYAISNIFTLSEPDPSHDGVEYESVYEVLGNKRIIMTKHTSMNEHFVKNTILEPHWKFDQLEIRIFGFKPIFAKIKQHGESITGFGR
jgi:hypothetical protein